MKAGIAARLLHHQERKERKAHKSRKDVVIPFTPEAEDLLRPYAEYFQRMDGETVEYIQKDTAGCFYEPKNAKLSVTIGRKLWIYTLGSCIAMEETKAQYETQKTGEIYETRPPVHFDEIPACVAECMISLFNKQGIVIE